MNMKIYNVMQYGAKICRLTTYVKAENRMLTSRRRITVQQKSGSIYLNRHFNWFPVSRLIK